MGHYYQDLYGSDGKCTADYSHHLQEIFKEDSKQWMDEDMTEKEEAAAITSVKTHEAAGPVFPIMHGSPCSSSNRVCPE